MQVFSTTITTPLGQVTLTSTDTHLLSVAFTNDRISKSSLTIPQILIDTTDQLNEYFTGTRKQFNLPLQMQGTDFQQRVRNSLLTIPYGTTITYGHQAKALLGDPLVVRASASANGQNPFSIIVPCHRVVGKDGSLTGYAGGIDKKRWLLDHEQRHSFFGG